MFEVWYVIDGLPMWLSGKESICQGRRCWRHRFNPSVGKISLWRRKRQSTPVFLPEKSHGQRSLVGYSPWCHKELDTTEWLNTHVCNWYNAPCPKICLLLSRNNEDNVHCQGKKKTTPLLNLKKMILLCKYCSNSAMMAWTNFSERVARWRKKQTIVQTKHLLIYESLQAI